MSIKESPNNKDHRRNSNLEKLIEPLKLDFSPQKSIVKNLNLSFSKLDISQNLSNDEDKSTNNQNIQNSNTPTQNEYEKLPHSELFYLGVNALSVIMNGVNHFHFKYMKKSVGSGYEEYSFTIWRCLFILTTNRILMYFRNESCDPFNKLVNNVWFWIRFFMQFITLQSMLILVTYFRVSTATCFISMSPLAIVILSTLLLNEKFYMRYVYGIFICFSGVLMIVFNEKKGGSNVTNVETEVSMSHVIIGFFWGISQLLAVAVHRVSSKKLINQKIKINTQLMYPTFGCIVLSIIFLLLSPSRHFKYGFWLIFHSFLNCFLWLCCTTLTLISFKGIDLIKTTAIGYLNIITVFILGVLFLGEKIYGTDVLGSLIILGFNIYNTVYPPHD